MAEHAAVAGEAVDLSRRKFLTQATIATGAVGVVCAAIPFVESWNPSERARALGVPTELDLSKLEAGQMAITLWRRQPIYIVRRTPDMLTRVSGHDADLKDPNSDESIQPEYAKNPDRARNAEFLVAHRYLHAPRVPAEAEASLPARFTPPGRAGSSVPATARVSTSPRGSSTARRPRPIWLSRGTSTPRSTC